MHHYVESGLDNIYLVNGFRHADTPYGKGLSIHNVEALHKVIGQSIVDEPRAINGAELRFIRVEMDLTQARLASLLGTEEQTLRRWEKARTKAVPGPADRMLRALYREYSGNDGNVRRMVERLAGLDAESPVRRMRFKETRKGWRPEAVG